jgi:YfiR/HmsC-like
MFTRPGMFREGIPQACGFEIATPVPRPSSIRSGLEPAAKRISALRVGGLLLLIQLTLMGRLLGDEPLSVGTYKYQADYLFNFASFISWPTNSFASPTAPFIVCSLASPEQNAAIELAFKDHPVNGHPVKFVALESVPADLQCHLLFVASPERERPIEILRKIKKNGVLTVGESDAFLNAGGVISLVSEEIPLKPGKFRIRFDLNRTAEASANLTIDRRAVQHARFVRSPKPVIDPP